MCLFSLSSIDMRIHELDFIPEHGPRNHDKPQRIGGSHLSTTANHATLSRMTDIKKYQGNASTTAALLDAGIALMRQNIRRRHSGQTEAEIDAMLSAWLRRTDDPIPGDTAGAVCVRTRES
jgi:hypothetical protein